MISTEFQLANTERLLQWLHEQLAAKLGEHDDPVARDFFTRGVRRQISEIEAELNDYRQRTESQTQTGT